MRLSLPIVVLSVVLGSGCNSGHRPTEPTDPRLTPTPTPIVTPPAPNARITGRVVDVDTGKPVAHAIVSVAGVCYSGTPFGRCMNVTQSPTAEADDAGAFVLAADLPPTWVDVQLKATRAGYEAVQKYVSPAEASDALLAAYPTVTIPLGGSVRTKLTPGIEACGWLSVNCRRIAIDAPAGTAVDVEVTDDEKLWVGLHPNNNIRDDNNWPRQLTVTNGEVWILGLGPVTVSARRR